MSNRISCFIHFHSLMNENDAKNHFLIMNTDRIDKERTHWSNISDLHAEKYIFLFDRFGFTRLKYFVIQDDKKNNK